MAGAASLCSSLAVSCLLNSQLATGRNQSLQKFWAVLLTAELGNSLPQLIVLRNCF